MNTFFSKCVLLALCINFIALDIFSMELPKNYDEQRIIGNSVKSKQLSLIKLPIPTVSSEVKEYTQDFINDVYKTSCKYFLAANQILSSFIAYPNASEADLHAITIVPQENSLTSHSIPIKDAFKQLIKSKDNIDIHIRDTQKILHMHYGIKSDHANDNFALFSRGFGYGCNITDGITNQGIGLIQCYKYYRDNIIHCPCFIFDYPGSVFGLNFGQSHDQECLQKIYQEIQSQNSHAKCMVLGLSMGAHTALRWIANYHPTNISAIILESPFISLHDTLDKIVDSNLPFLQQCPHLCKACIETAFISFNKKNDCLMEEVKQFPSNLPLLIVHLKDEKVISNTAMITLINALKSTGNSDIYFLVIADPKHTLKHGKLSISKIFQRAVNAFLATYNLPCDKDLTREGQPLLKLAKENSQIQDIEKLHIFEEQSS